MSGLRSALLAAAFAAAPASTRASLQVAGVGAAAEERVVWQQFGEHIVAGDDEGVPVAQGDLEACQRSCERDAACRSVTHCPGSCRLQTSQLDPASPTRRSPGCTTYFAGAAPTPAPPAAARRAAGVEAECYEIETALRMTDLQKYSMNFEAEARGLVRLMLCTNGTTSGSLAVTGIASDIIAAVIHECEGASTGEDCTGPPKMAFCGDNSPGLMDIGTPYAAICGAADSHGKSVTHGMAGVVVGGASLAEVVHNIGTNPTKFYFNIYTSLSRMHYYPGVDQGVARGTLHVVPPATPDNPEVTLTPSPGTCFNMFSQLVTNELQQYEDNREADVSAYVDVKLCTNGTMRAFATLFGKITPLVAVHIHRCGSGGSSTITAERCEGGPVVNFCGINAPGFLLDGARYPNPCPRPDDREISSMDMEGALVSGARSLEVVEQEIRHIVEHPELYFFNLHSLASYAKWYPSHRGMVRGPLQK